MVLLLDLTDDRVQQLPSSLGHAHAHARSLFLPSYIAGGVAADVSGRPVKWSCGHAEAGDTSSDARIDHGLGVNGDARDGDSRSLANNVANADDTGRLQDGSPSTTHGHQVSHEQEAQENRQRQQQTNPNFNNLTTALGCYPIISQITHSIDLNTLHSLSLTCKQIRANILPFRAQLVRQTVRCKYEGLPLSDAPLRYHRLIALLTPGRSSASAPLDQLEQALSRQGCCARDLVGDCRRCGRVICRNCINKPPPSTALIDRHRRLCPTCLAVPIKQHTLPPSSPVELLEHRFTAPAFLRDPCCCPERIWLCRECGQSRRTTDTTYRRVWTWRSRYSTYLGGIGTGIGEGNEGVKCGRDINCLAVREVEVEVDCEGEDLAAYVEDTTAASASTAAAAAAATAATSSSKLREPDEDAKIATAECKNDDGTKETVGYLRQEIEGIGGVVKKKLKTRVKVGAVVEEYEDERENIDYLAREAHGEERSWCGWCDRVIPGPNDLDDLI